MILRAIQSLLIAALIFLFWQDAAQAQNRCTGMDMQINPGSYNLTSNNFPTINLQVSRNNTNKGCDYFVVIDYGSATTAATRRLTNSTYTYPVQLYKDSGKSQIIKKLTDASSSGDILSGNFPDSAGSTSATLSFFAFLDPSLYSRFGNYTENFNVSLYSGDLTNNQLERTRTLTLTYTQPKRIDLSLVNTGSAFDSQDTSQTMNFGNLVVGAKQSFDVIVGYNAGYRMTLASTNKGRLKHTTLASYVAYTMTVNNTTVNLSTGTATLPSVTGLSPAEGQRLPVQVTIGSIVGASGGSYNDTVTFSVVSVE